MKTISLELDLWKDLKKYFFNPFWKNSIFDKDLPPDDNVTDEIW